MQITKLLILFKVVSGGPKIHSPKSNGFQRARERERKNKAQNGKLL
jgi:hypothetical protein